MMNSKWYSWDRQWFNLATYTFLEGQKLIWRHLDGEDEKCKVVPLDYEVNEEEHDWDPEQWDNDLER